MGPDVEQPDYKKHAVAPSDLTDGFDTCPDCGRRKAHSADDCCKGYCSKWYAIRDLECREECEELTRARQVSNELSSPAAEGSPSGARG